jgi:hypothetical protein
MQVIVRVRPDVAPALHGRQPPTQASEAILQAMTELGVVLEPMHPGVEDPSLASFFMIEVPDPASAERVIARLQQSQAIEAAYLKPPDALP